MLARHVVEVQARMNAIRNPDAKEGIVAAYIRKIDSTLDPELGKVSDSSTIPYYTMLLLSVPQSANLSIFFG